MMTDFELIFLSLIFIAFVLYLLALRMASKHDSKFKGSLFWKLTFLLVVWMMAVLILVGGMRL